MANKTLVFNDDAYQDEDNFVLFLVSPIDGSIGNGTGDPVTPGANGHFSCVVTAAVTGLWLVYIKLNDVSVMRGVVNIASDTAGVYPVNGSSAMPDKLQTIQDSIDTVQDGIDDIKDILDNPETPEKVMVNQDFGGEGNLTYTLNGDPVADALIELFLYSDYAAGDYNSNRLDSTRQRIDGTWAKAFYLDPQEYVVRFYRTGVAGPDAYKLVVSFDEDEIEVTPL